MLKQICNESRVWDLMGRIGGRLTPICTESAKCIQETHGEQQPEQITQNPMSQGKWAFNSLWIRSSGALDRCHPIILGPGILQLCMSFV